jgi:two-component system CheB/CheR fusion protein
MPEQLLALVSQEETMLRKAGRRLSAQEENTISKIFNLLRSQSGHDFSKYKINTTRRRIERRMIVSKIKTLENYLKILQQDPSEVDALFRDRLIGVTSFFRDPHTFHIIEERVIPALFQKNQPVPIFGSGSPDVQPAKKHTPTPSL